MTAEIRFEIDADRIGQIYGVQVFICDSDDIEDAGGEPYYMLFFKGPEADVDPSSVAQIFGNCHIESMDSLGIEGVLDEDEFDKLMDDSLELAGDLMGRHGFKALDVDEVDKDVQDAFFSEASTLDPSSLN